MNSVLIKFASVPNDVSPMAYFKKASKKSFSNIVTSQPNINETFCFTDQILISGLKNINNYNITETYTNSPLYFKNSFSIPSNHYNIDSLVKLLNTNLKMIQFEVQTTYTKYQGICQYSFSLRQPPENAIVLEMDVELSYLLGFISLEQLKMNNSKFVSKTIYAQKKEKTTFNLIKHLHCLSLHTSFLKCDDKLTYLYLSEANIEQLLNDSVNYVNPHSQKLIKVISNDIGKAI
jgi:hypothetical protein